MYEVYHMTSSHLISDILIEAVFVQRLKVYFTKTKNLVVVGQGILIPFLELLYIRSLSTYRPRVSPTESLLQDRHVIYMHCLLSL